MGNVSNPVINRLGVNTFWYRFWYSDVSYSNNLKQDLIFSKLLNIYLYYGINLPNTLFFSNYWYKSNLQSINKVNYYRHFTFKNKILGIESAYRLRTKITDIYPMKLWLLRFNNWIIINFYWFQPNKKKITFNKQQKNHYDILNIKPNVKKQNQTWRKIKTIVSQKFIYQLLKKQYYQF